MESEKEPETEGNGFLNGIPQRGWILDTALAQAMGIHIKTLRRLLVSRRIEHKIVAKGVLLLDVERFYASLPSGPEVDEMQVEE